MGTNYYAVVNPCPLCGKSEITLHIGKSSAGWTFSFAVQTETSIGTIKSYKQWKKLLRNKGVRIKDEYDSYIPYKNFNELVKSKMKARYNHAIKSPGNNNFVDSEGHSFSQYEFC